MDEINAPAVVTQNQYSQNGWHVESKAGTCEIALMTNDAISALWVPKLLKKVAK